ncbi:MAG: hypothetical protein ACJ71P_03475 [Nitrososphaeraceae archaeon]
MLETIKNWVKEDGKYNTEEVYNPKTHFTLSLFSKEEFLKYDISLLTVDNPTCNT